MSPGQGRGRRGDLEVGAWSEREGWAGTDGPGLTLLTGDVEPQAASLVCLPRALPVSQPAYHNCLLTSFLPLPFQPPYSCPIPLQSAGIQISSSCSCSGTLRGSPLPEPKVPALPFGVVSGLPVAPSPAPSTTTCLVLQLQQTAHHPLTCLTILLPTVPLLLCCAHPSGATLLFFPRCLSWEADLQRQWSGFPWPL